MNAILSFRSADISVSYKVWDRTWNCVEHSIAVSIVLTGTSCVMSISDTPTAKRVKNHWWQNEHRRRKRCGRVEAAQRCFLEGICQARAALRGRWVRWQLLVTPGAGCGITRDSLLVLGKINIVQGFKPDNRHGSVRYSRHLRASLENGDQNSKTKQTLRRVLIYSFFFTI